MIIIQDTREQNGWGFFGHDVIRQKLDCGDYTIPSLLGKFAIERKATLGELYLNLASLKSKARFHRELMKLKELDEALILCEFPERNIYEFPLNSGIPQWRYPTPAEVAAGKGERGTKVNAWEFLKISPKYLRRLLHEVEEIVPIVYCDSPASAEGYALNLFENKA